MLVNQYQKSKKHSIGQHWDDRSQGSVVVGLSLLGDATMTLVHVKSKEKDKPTRRMLLSRRSLYVMSGKSRYDWEHGIENKDLVDEHRISVTFRTVSN